MNKKLHATLIGRNKDTVSVVQNLISGISWLELHNHIANNGYADLMRGLDKIPDILIVDLSTIWREELEALNALNKIPPATRPQVIVIGGENNTEVMSAAMKIGSRGYFPHPIDVEDFRESLNTIAVDHFQTNKNEHARLITVMNGKGGSGATMIASNLSHILAEKNKKRVALLDLHNSITSLPLYFDLGIKHTLGDALNNINAFDETALQGSMEKYSENLFILSSRHDVIADSTQLSESALKRLLQLANKSFDYIIVDMPASMNAANLTILQNSDQIFLVTQQSIPHISETSLLYKAMTKQHGVTKEKINIIVNRFIVKDAIRIEDIKNALGNNVITVPSDYKTVTTSLNVGRPLYESAKRAKVTQSIINICKNLVSSKKCINRGKWIQPITGIFQS